MIDFAGLAKASSVSTPKETKPSIAELSIEKILYLYSLCDDKQAKEFVLRLTDEQRAALQQKSEALEDEVTAEYFDTDSSDEEPEDLEDSDEDSDAENFFGDDSDEEDEDSEEYDEDSEEYDEDSEEYDEDSDEDEDSEEYDEDSEEYDEDADEYDEDSEEYDEDADEDEEYSEEYSEEEDEELDEDYANDTESVANKHNEGVLPPASDEYIDLFDNDEDEPEDEPEAPSTVDTNVIAKLFGQSAAKPAQTPIIESDDEYEDSDEEYEDSEEYDDDSDEEYEDVDEYFGDEDLEDEDSDEECEDSEEYDDDSDEEYEDSEEEEEQEYSEDEDSAEKEEPEYPEYEVSDEYSESPSEGISAPDENIEATPPTLAIQKSELGGTAKDIFSQVMSMPSPDEELAHNPYIREVDKFVTARNTQANQVEKAVGTITQGYDIMKDTEPEVKSLCGEVYREGWSLTKYLQANRGNKQACSKEVVLHYYSPETVQRGEDMGKFVISRGILRF